MKIIPQTPDTLFEINGRIFPDREEAVIEARAAINRIAEATAEQNSLTVSGISFERFVAEEPPGAIVVEGSISVTCPTTPGLLTIKVPQIVRPVKLGSRNHGQFLAKRWTKNEVIKWERFWHQYRHDNFRGCTPEEIHLGSVASTVSLFKASAEMQRLLLGELTIRWRAAANDLERDQVGETLLCAHDLGFPFTLHEALHTCPELALRAEQLARIRDVAGHSDIPEAKTEK